MVTNLLSCKLSRAGQEPSNFFGPGQGSIFLQDKIISVFNLSTHKSAAIQPLSVLWSLANTMKTNTNIDSPGNVRRSFVASPEKEDRYYTTRGSMGTYESGKLIKEPVKETKKHMWPKLFMTLSNKEKEEDLLAMKGCKLPQRPKKRAKLVQMTLLLLVSPGTWLSDLCKERYEVREKKTSKKRPRGLKAMGSMESDSE
ncbi:unnamed protein product [Brassica oleracea var. botrytis]